MDFDSIWTVPAPEPPAARSFNGTPQQVDFFDALTTTSGNIVLEARAGTGKSTSCREGMHRLIDSGVPAHAIRYTAFNRDIADEFRAKAPRGSDVGTFHSFCNRGLSQAIGRAVVERSKSYMMMDDLCILRTNGRFLRKSVARLASGAKNSNYDVSAGDAVNHRTLSGIVDALDIETFGKLDDVIEAADAVLLRSIERTDVIDYDDMLWLAYWLGVSFPLCDVLFVDECQDLNGVQHDLLPRLNPSGRTVAVGDRFQSIYGFRGADVDSIPRLISRLGADVLPLTVTFRCPRSHVRLARQWVRDFDAADGNAEGSIERTDNPDALLDAKPGDQVLCRRNAPLVTAALSAIGAGVPAYVRGRAFGDELKPIVQKCDAPTIPVFIKNVDAWLGRKLAILAEKEGADDLVERVTDQAETIKAVAGGCQTPADVSTALSRLFDDVDDGERVTYSSVHRAKGTEAPHIYLIETGGGAIRRKRPPTPAEEQQSRNVSYVAHTRSLSALTVVHCG